MVRPKEAHDDAAYLNRLVADPRLPADPVAVVRPVASRNSG